LAFLPPGDVPATFAGMVLDFQPDETAFLKYFEKTWVGELLRTGLRKAPVFPVELWSVHGRALGRSFLTNNNAEVFHGNYRTHLVPGKHPSMPTFVEGLKSQQRLTQNDVAQLSMGASKKERPVTVTRTERLGKLCEKYNEDFDTAFLLDGVANLYLQMA
jgi:hypothetical protein